MATPITWSGATSVSLSSSVDSDPIELNGTVVGWSAILNVLGEAPSGIGGNFQIAVSNTGAPGSFVALPGSLQTVGVGDDQTEPYLWSELVFYNYALIRWTQAGPNTAGLAFDGYWSVTEYPAVAPTPPPPIAQTPTVFGGATFPVSTDELYALLLDCFPPSWIPTVNIQTGDVNDAIFTSLAVGLGQAGDLALPVGGVAPAAVTIAQSTGATLDQIALILFAGQLPRAPGQSDFSYQATMLAALQTPTSQASQLRQNLRIATAFGPMLDQISLDFYGGQLPRLLSESDQHYRNRIVAGLFIGRITRQNIYNFLLNLTGIAPRVAEPLKPYDAGAWGRGGWGVDADVHTVSNGIYRAGFRWSGAPYVGAVDTTYPQSFVYQGDPVVCTFASVQTTPSVSVLAGGAQGGWASIRTYPGPNPPPASVLGGSSNFAWANPRGLMAADLIAGRVAVLSQLDKLRPAGVLLLGRMLPAVTLAESGATSPATGGWTV